jgi:hypothetical protein
MNLDQNHGSRLMRERTTQVLLAAVAALLAAHLLRPSPALPAARGQDAGPVSAVLRAHAVELVDKQGKVVAQLHVGEDGGGNLRLRSGDGTVRVKLAGTADGSGLLLFDTEAEPAVWLAANKAGTRVTLAEKGKAKRVIEP